MHIGVISPPWFPVPPDGYGGIERVVFDLVESFVEAGERVTLFAPAGSHTSATLEAMLPQATGLDMPEHDRLDLLQGYGQQAQDAAESLGVDLICDHTEAIHNRRWSVPVFRTIHGSVTKQRLELCRGYVQSGEHLIGISQRQVDLFEQASVLEPGESPALRFMAAIHNPVDVESAPFYPASEKEHYAAYVGRCHPEKGPVEAIEVAKRTGIPLRMALRISDEERPYFTNTVEPLLNASSAFVDYVGEVRGNDRDELFGRASVLIFSSIWEEPFGLTIIEALARGTPVIALARGSAPELLRHGVTGILCDDFDEMTERIGEAIALDPVNCRDDALQRFDRRGIAAKHLALIRKTLGLQTVPDSPDSGLLSAEAKAEETPHRGPLRKNPAAV